MIDTQAPKSLASVAGAARMTPSLDSRGPEEQEVGTVSMGAVLELLMAWVKTTLPVARVAAPRRSYFEVCCR